MTTKAKGCKQKKSPKFLDKVTFIAHFAFYQCGTDLTVYAQTGGKALANAGLMIVGTTWDDVARELFRPKGQRIAAHGGDWKRNKRRGKSKALLTDTAELIGKPLRAVEAIKVPTYELGDLLIWELDNFVQKQLYKVLIVNVVADFGFDWFSGMLEAKGTDCAAKHVIARDSPLGTKLDTTFWSAPNMAPINSHPLTRFQNSYLIPEGSWWFVWRADWVNGFSPIATQGKLAGMCTEFGDEYVFGSGEAVVCTAGQRKTASFKGRITGPNKFTAVVSIDAPFGSGWDSASMKLAIFPLD